MSTRPVAGHQSSGLQVAYRRSDLEPTASAFDEPSLWEKLLGHALTILPFVGTVALLMKLVHRRGGRSVIGLLPHVFDATSTVKSGAFALAALVAAIAVGFIGVKAYPRSYAMLGSAGMLLIASLAMVTVTLVSTDENPSPPDGALLIPYVVPLALVLLGIGIAGRGLVMFLRGGVRRAAPLLVGAIGGALVFAGIELSALASRLSIL
jgi:hypothetical protein